MRWDLADPAKAKVEPIAPGGTVKAGAGADPRGISTGPHGEIVREFVEAVRAGRPPRIDGHEGRRGLAAVLGIYEAAPAAAAPRRLRPTAQRSVVRLDASPRGSSVSRRPSPSR